MSVLLPYRVIYQISLCRTFQRSCYESASRHIYLPKKHQTSNWDIACLHLDDISDVRASPKKGNLAPRAS